MKIIRKYTCYVELEDILYLGVVPDDVLSEIKNKVYYSPFIKFIRFEKEESLKYFKKKKEIINYDSICNLSNDELDTKISEISVKLNNYSSKWLEASKQEREKLDNDNPYNSNIKSLKYMLESLKKYKDNRELYDKEIKQLSFNGIKKVKLNYVQAVTTTKPVARIPVPSSHMEELDRSIRNKCEQNARRRIQGEDTVKNYIVGQGTINFNSNTKEKVLKKTIN